MAPSNIGPAPPCARVGFVKTNLRMKLLFITIIALVIPLFFILVFVMSAVNKLKRLRQQCLDIRECADEPKARSDFNFAAEQYNAARRQFPNNFLATMWGFREMEPLAGPCATGGQPADGPVPSERGPTG